MDAMMTPTTIAEMLASVLRLGSRVLRIHEAKSVATGVVACFLLRCARENYNQNMYRRTLSI